MRRVLFCLTVGALGAASLTGCSGDKGTSTGTTAAPTTAVPVPQTTAQASAVTEPQTTAAPSTTVLGTPVLVTASDYLLTVDRASVQPGAVTFTLANTGAERHDMVVLKTDEPFDGLAVDPYFTVSEDTAVGKIGRVSSGSSSILSLDLEPGRYVLVCNISTHYQAGMRVAFTVTN